MISNRPTAYGLAALVVGDLGVNCYLFWDLATHAAMVVDPGAEPERVLSALDHDRLHLAWIVNTHGHADHIGGNAELQRATGARLLIHAGDRALLTDPRANLSTSFGAPIVSSPANELLSPEHPVTIGRWSFRVLATPGHTPGSVCLFGAGLLFSGDTLFAGSVGRTDLPGGDRTRLAASLQTLLRELPNDTKVLPGHGPATDLGTERRSNPYLRSGGAV